jgi:UDP-N-acetylglucosamine kinase
MDYAQWAKDNKKLIAREFIRKTNYVSRQEPSGIFTAGLPGAGKTEFTVELIKNIEPKPLRIDMDEIAQSIEGYKPKIADKFRGGASIILSRIYDEVIKHNIDFVFDGTFSSDGALNNLKRALSHNYKVKVYYIHQDPAVAWQFTKDRELVEHRSIEVAGFIDTYYKLERNLIQLCKDHKDVTISLVVKDDKNKIGQLVENVNDELFDKLPNFLTEDQLKAVII